MAALADLAPSLDVVECMLHRDALGGGAPVELRETHCSWVFLTPDRAYKVKKPVVLPFLDYGTLARRHEMCRAELALNRRLAPGTYHAVRALVPTGDGLALVDEYTPGAVEYVVEMRRYPEEETLAARLARGEVTAADMVAVGEYLARFHAGCPVMPVAAGAETVKRTVDDTFASLMTLLRGDAAARAGIVAAERFSDAFLGAHWEALDARAAAGAIRDGHGDLRAEHVVLDQGLEIVDAIEFDRSLRWIDVGLDLAFLFMDLLRAGAPEHARTLVDAYRGAGGDPGDDGLIAFFAAYRAQVRAKVALLRAAQLGNASAAGLAARGQARELLALADRLAWTGRRTRVLVVAGVAASGKSTLAAAVASASGATQLSSDVVRKSMLGLAPTDRAPASAYEPEVSEATYAELGRRAAGAGTVVVDATFRRRRERDAFATGLGSAADGAVFVECRAPARVLEARAHERASGPAHESDATADVVRVQLREFEPLDELSAGAHLILRSDRPIASMVADVADALDRRLAPDAEKSTGRQSP